MIEFPPTHTFGTPPNERVYTLDPNHLVVHFPEDMEDGEIGSALNELLNIAIAELHVVEDPTPPFGPSAWSGGKIRVIELPPGSIQLFELAQWVRANVPGAFLATPIYMDSKKVNTAVTPVLNALIARAQPGFAPEEFVSATNDAGYTIVEAPPDMPDAFYRLRLTEEGGEGEDVDRGVDQIAALSRREDLASRAGMLSIDYDWIVLAPYQAAKPDDPGWDDQWDMHRINVLDAWDRAPFVSEVWVAVIDDWVDRHNEDLRYTPPSTWLHFGPGADPPGSPHGTAVAGIIAAVANNKRGIAGIAQGCRIMPIGLGATYLESEIEKAIRWAVAQGARVINLSLAGSPSALIEESIRIAIASNVVVCAAAGNDDLSTIGFPAVLTGVLAIGAINKFDVRKPAGLAAGDEWGSNFGNGLDVVAPGVEIVSTPRFGAAADVLETTLAATSAATPHTSGLAALLLSRFPGLSADDVRDIIRRTCRKIPNPPGVVFAALPLADPADTELFWNREVGYGIIDCLAAMDRAAGVTPSSGQEVEGFGPLDTTSDPLRLFCTPDLGIWYDIPRAAVLRMVPVPKPGGRPGLPRIRVVVDPTVKLVPSRR